MTAFSIRLCLCEDKDCIFGILNPQLQVQGHSKYLWMNESWQCKETIGMKGYILNNSVLNLAKVLGLGIFLSSDHRVTNNSSSNLG